MELEHKALGTNPNLCAACLSLTDGTWAAGAPEPGTEGCAGTEFSLRTLEGPTEFGDISGPL